MEQGMLSLFGAVVPGGIKDVPADVIRQCRNYQDALKVAIAHAPDDLTWDEVGSRLGYDSGQWSRILNCDLAKGGKGARYMNPAKYEEFGHIVKNNGLYKYFVMEALGLLNRQRQDVRARKAELLEELKKLEQLEFIAA